MRAWLHFGVPAGQALVIAGFLDLLIGMAKCLHSSMRSVYGAGNNRKELTEFIWHLDYLELAQATIEGGKIILALMLWIGMILIGRLLILKVWMYLTTAIDIIQMILIGVINYHFWITETVSVSPLHFMYLAVIRLLIRAYLITVAVNYNRVYAKFRAKGELAASANISPAIQQRQREAQNELARDLMPIGLGFTRLFQFYLGDADRLAKFLLISDLVWCICKVLSREISQSLFEREESFYPSSTFLTPILVEERFIRVFRIFFDIYFIRSIHKNTLARQSWWILPKFMELIISIGILIFVIVTEKNTFAPFVTVLFCLFFISDLFYRMVLLGTCLKSYVNHREKIASSARKRTTHNQQT